MPSSWWKWHRGHLSGSGAEVSACGRDAHPRLSAAHDGRLRAPCYGFACLPGVQLSQIELPGVYRDEFDKLVPTVALLTGQPFLWIGWCTTVFGYCVLVSFTERVGPVSILGEGFGP
jgi:hypothetical protein